PGLIMPALASLPMYDRPELRAANTRLWEAIRRHLPHAPASLSFPDDLWLHWRSPDLWVSQTCGLPYRAHLHGRLTLLGTPDYGLDGCPPGFYRSAIVIRRDDPRRSFIEFQQARLAYNEPLSQSGWAAPFFHARKHGFAFSDLLQTGSHSASAQAVIRGAADLAALDAQSWRLMQRYDAWSVALRVVDYTAPTPALPFVTAQNDVVSEIKEAVQTAIAALSPEDRHMLDLKGLIDIPHDAYLAYPLPEKPDEKSNKGTPAP
ncbi:MAG: PhnD/SsuA/transferrin family substrate-binding protein, partial [Pseudomonadota bacterium]